MRPQLPGMRAATSRRSLGDTLRWDNHCFGSSLWSCPISVRRCPSDTAVAGPGDVTDRSAALPGVQQALLRHQCRIPEHCNPELIPARHTPLQADQKNFSRPSLQLRFGADTGDVTGTRHAQPKNRCRVMADIRTHHSSRRRRCGCRLTRGPHAGVQAAHPRLGRSNRRRLPASAHPSRSFRSGSLNQSRGTCRPYPGFPLHPCSDRFSPRSGGTTSR